MTQPINRPGENLPERVAAPHPRPDLACRQIDLQPHPVNTESGKIHCYFIGLTPPIKSGGNALSPSPYGERAEISTARKPGGPRVRGSRLFGAIILTMHTFIAMAQPASAQTRRSATEFLSPDLRAQQADDGANPGMLWVSQGAQLWSTQPAADGAKSCAGCHGDSAASMKGTATRYPQVDAASGQLLNLEGRINQCRTTRQNQSALTYESDELLGLTAFVAHQSRGMPLAVKTDGAAAPFFEAGKAFYVERQGQLNVSCAQCHDDRVGNRLRGDTISSGLTGAYPAYRLDWQKAGSLHRRLRACSLGVRAVQLPAGSAEYLALELYLNWRGAGTPIETPGIRK
jgi:L-cysteine S-thiosulfotransferase